MQVKERDKKEEGVPFKGSSGRKRRSKKRNKKRKKKTVKMRKR